MKPSRPSPEEDLRRRAEARLQRQAAPNAAEESAADRLRLLHELQVHQIELEMQNEELRCSQAELETVQAHYFELFDLAPVGYLTLSFQGLILEANLAAAHLLGLARGAMLKQALSGYILPEDQDLYHRHRIQLQATGSAQAVELRLIKPDASPFWARLETKPALAGDGTAMFRTVLIDIDARIRAEEALRIADRQKDQFLAMLGHELRNPLAAIVNALSVLQAMDRPDPRLKWGCEVIDRQSRHLSRLLDDLLDVARITQNKIALKSEPLDLAVALESAVENCRTQADARRQTLTLRLPPALPWLNADRVRLEQVFSNLLTNAVKYTPEGGEITVSATREGDQAVIRFADTGIGISAELLPRIFDLFTQADLSLAHAEGGLGLGLTVVRSLVELHGGSVSASSQGIDLGSEFTVRLPVPSAECVQTDPASMLANGDSQPASSFGIKVLVVDDYAEGARSMAYLLSLRGYQVETVDCGVKALDRAAAFRPQVILLDIGLSDLDGYEVARRLRAMPETRQTLLVALSGSSEDPEKSRAAGFDHYLMKPMSYAAFRSLLD